MRTPGIPRSFLPVLFGAIIVAAVPAPSQKPPHDAAPRLSGFGVIDRMSARDPYLRFRVDGYNIRLTQDTDIDYKGDIGALADVSAGTWIHYEGSRNSFGEVVASSIRFIRPHLKKTKEDPTKTAQVTDFPPGSIIDTGGDFRINRKPDKTMDTPGGECGWYPVPDVPSVQSHIRQLGMKLIPQYQRDLPDDNPAKIRFRFYLVEEKSIRAALSCHEGLVLIPATVINRVTSEDQLAAVVADGIAATLQRQQARVAIEWRTLWEEAGFAALGAAGDSWGLGFAGGTVGNALVRHNMERKLENQRGRVALTLLADAGYDPWQAPEAWRLLGPERLPKDPAKIKYPERAEYQLDLLRLQYKSARASAAGVKDATAKPN